MKYVDYENQVNSEIMFNLQISFQDAERYIDPEFLRAPEGERATFGSFSIGKFGNNISIIGNACEFFKTSWWNEIKNNLDIADMDEGNDIWNIDFVDI